MKPSKKRVLGKKRLLLRKKRLMKLLEQNSIEKKVFSQKNRGKNRKKRENIKIIIPNSLTLDYTLKMISGMKDNYKFSFIASAIRDYYYEDFYYRINFVNKVPFEIVFVGNKKPLRAMPDNFHYIETDVKPSQCWEIAARRAKGEFLIFTGDDCRYNEGFLDKIMVHCNKTDMDNNFILFRHMNPSHRNIALTGIRCADGSRWYTSGGFVVKKDVWHKIGGIDKRIWGGGISVDIQQRLYQLGFNVVFAGDCVTREIENTPTIGDTGMKRMTIRDCEVGSDKPPIFWTNENGIPKRIPFLPFDDNDILIKDQY